MSRDMTTAYDWARADLTLMRRQEFSRRAGGETQAKDLGPSLWMAAFQTPPMPAAAARGYHADLLSLGGALTTFYLSPVPGEPEARDGETLAGVTIASISSDNDAVALTGLPAGFVMTAGDYLSIDTGDGIEFHQVAQGGAANASGVTGELRVVPHVRPVVSDGDAVRLVNPRVEMRLQPGSLRHERLNLVLSRVSFEAVQVLR
ncbi:MAG: hypothetical protein ACLFRU_10885 [Paracoccaceae bacterium]